jgi:prolyl oligopeptidase
MKPLIKVCNSIVLVLLLINSVKSQGIHYPETRKDTVVDSYFGTKVPDPYRWLENPNSLEVKNWVKAQNNFTLKNIDKRNLAVSVKNDIKYKSDYYLSILGEKENEIRLLYTSGWDEYGVTEFKGVDDYDAAPFLYVRRKIDDPWVVLADPNDYKTKTTDKINITYYQASKDNKYVAFSVAKNGSDWREIHVKEIQSKKELPVVLKWVKFSDIVWLDNGFFYTKFDAPEKGQELIAKNSKYNLCFHEIGKSQNDDLIFGIDNVEDISLLDSTHIVAQGRIVKNKKSFFTYSIVSPKDTIKTSHHFLVFPQKGKTKVEVLKLTNDTAIVFTNLGASSGRILKYVIKSTNLFKIHVPEFEEILYDAFFIKEKLNCLYLKDMSVFMLGFDSKGKICNRFNFAKYCYPYFNTDNKKGFECTYFERALDRPAVPYTFNFKDYSSIIKSKGLVTFNPNNLELQLVEYPSKDGTKVSMMLFYKKGIKLNGNNPLILEAYGGFGTINFPTFDPAKIFWIENGGISAIAFVRGGGEKGEDWHLNGYKAKFQNSIDDYLSAAKYLIDTKYTSSQKLIANGASHGAYLITNAVFQAPELFKIAIPEVGAYDMLRFQHFTIGEDWKREYGISSDSIDFKNLIKTSPLQNIKNGFPNPIMLVVTGDHDDRVPPMHSYKFVAAMQAKCKNENPIYLLSHHNMGHSGGSTKNENAWWEASKYTFICDVLGIKPYFYH